MNIIELIATISAWIVIGWLTNFLYTKQEVRPTLWKVLLIIFIGFFTFSINWQMFNSYIKIPILPLGVWILYAVFKNKSKKWELYRPFAWLGFYANFIFLIALLLALPFNHFIYPESEFETYISNIENASVVNIHPSAKDSSLDKERLKKQTPFLSDELVQSHEWYLEMELNKHSKKVVERFPYQLIGFSTKWGSGLKTVVYLEKDGKGILISTKNKQLYFRSEHSLIKGGN
ncbi:hypothetical protein [Paenisporosarcina quisquiliarum]|uniref:hypothetical protein n=1 Tax=Paenisporosarcina quisquiliarum TaxID=365346 RepID=UPI003735E5FA